MVWVVFFCFLMLDLGYKEKKKNQSRILSDAEPPTYFCWLEDDPLL